MACGERMGASPAPDWPAAPPDCNTARRPDQRPRFESDWPPTSGSDWKCPDGDPVRRRAGRGSREANHHGPLSASGPSRATGLATATPRAPSRSPAGLSGAQLRIQKGTGSSAAPALSLGAHPGVAAQAIGLVGADGLRGAGPLSTLGSAPPVAPRKLFFVRFWLSNGDQLLLEPSRR